MHVFMDSLHTASIQSAELVLPAAALDETLAFFTAQLGFRVVSVYPADDPQAIVVDGHGVRLQLNRTATGDPGVLRLLCLQPDRVAGGKRSLVAPNGTRIDIIDADPPLVMPALRSGLVVTRAAAEAVWHAGRAGLFYRDLLPDRLGGRYIASHIRITEAGPVADYVHFHKVRFQMIFCRKGWVRVVYEDQGEPFVMQAGDCVLQPPRIRHRVLESSAAMEVVEVSCPALHETFADPALDLPNARLRPQRDFEGQRFVRHVAEGSAWTPWRAPGFAFRDMGIGAATAQLAGARVVRTNGIAETPPMRHAGDFLFFFVLAGSMNLHADGAHALAADDCCAIPAGVDYRFAACSPDLELLEVALPAQAA